MESSDENNKMISDDRKLGKNIEEENETK